MKLRYYIGCSLLLFNGLCQAENFALLIGISNYPDLYSLEGPEYDVNAINTALTKRWGFSPNNVVRLINERATKAAILQSIDKLYQQSQTGDNIFIYFSGHGTSQHDLTFNLPLPHTTGAFIPYGNYRQKNEAQLLEQLIIGARDLRPRFEKFDTGGRHLFMVVDACYAGNTVRGRFFKNLLPERYVNLFVKSKNNKEFVNKVSKQTTPYPYTNIFYLGAASQYEKAVDISNAWLDRYPTVDGNPHGAFTDSLLRALRSPLAVDKDRNGRVSYGELTQGISAILHSRQVNHTPQGLPIPAEDINNINDKNVFFITPENIL